MENTIYKDELTKSMNYLASKDNTIFVGQQIVYKGNPMSTTIEEVPKEKMIETPVFEEVQLGMSTGLIRVGKGSDMPLDPGVQHKADYSEAYSTILDNIEVVNFHTHENIYETYVNAYKNRKPIILAEYPEKYYA